MVDALFFLIQCDPSLIYFFLFQRESQTMPSACATSGWHNSAKFNSAKYSTVMTMIITTGIYLVFPCVKIYSKSFACFISFIPHAIP